MKTQSIKYHILLFLFVFIFFSGCKINLGGGRSMGYSVTGASTGGAQTAVVLYFQDRSTLVQPMLAQTLTQKLKDKIQSQTSLKLVNKDGDVNFEGSIENVSVQASASAGGNNITPSTNRLTVTIKIKYNNTKDPHFDFESSFSRFADAAGSATIDQIVTAKLDGITDQLVDDVFTKAFVNW